MTFNEILFKYPVKNPAWRNHEGTEVFTKWDSDNGGTNLDPWNRPMPWEPVKIERDREGEIQCWHYVTTVAGTPVTLVVYND